MAKHTNRPSGLRRPFSTAAVLLIGLLAILAQALSASAASSPSIVINEIMYHPPGTNHLEQWFELQNTGTKAVDLSGWQVTKGVHFQFPTGTIMPAGAFLVVAADAATFQSSHPGVANFVAGWTGKLGHVLEISDNAGKVVDSVEFYSDGDWATRVMGPIQYNHQGWVWDAPADGRGASLELINSSLPNSYAHNWAPNKNLSGTPGQPNSVATDNAVPFISGVAHWPKIPHPSDVVSITARVVDENIATTTVTLHWRLDGQKTFQQAAMLDDGAHQDGLKGDGLYGAFLPAQPEHAIVEFFITATDGSGQTRQYPSFVPPSNSSRTANLLYQVDSGATLNAQPIYRIIMTEAERAEIYALGRGCPDSDSDAEMNATWVTSDGVLANGTTTEVRYNVSVRNRGHGTRQSNPNNYHINIPADRLWKGQAGINLNSQYAFSQVIGSAVMRAAGVAMPDSRAVQVRVNSTNLMSLPLNDINSFGSYAANEQYNGDFIQRTFPLDPNGNSYRGIRDQVLCDPSVNSVADLKWHGANWAIPVYTNAYFKQNNFVANDWSDLIRLLSVLNVTNGTTAATYVADVQKTLNVEEWMRYMAVNTLLDNQETALANGVGDDYALYRGAVDTRFQALPYDLDTVMGRGLSSASPRDGIFLMTNLPTMDRFIKTPEFAPIYYAQLKDLADSVFAPDRMNPLVDQLLGGYVPADTVQIMKAFNASHRAYVLSQIPLALSAAVALPQVDGYFHATTAAAVVTGTANAIDTRQVRVNGQTADWVAWQGTWRVNVTLAPGLNRLTIRSIGANQIEVARTNLDIWFDAGAPQSAPAVIAGEVHWTAAGGPYEAASGITINSGATLTIDPGTTVYLGSGANLTVNNGGRLLAEGTEAAPIRFTRAPGTTALWGGIVINGAVGSPETRISHAFIEFNGSTAIHSSAGTVFLDYLEFGTTDKQFVSLDSSSFVVSHCHFPTPTAAFEPGHGTGGVKQGGHGIFYRNFFGPPNGYNDVVDFTGGQRGGPLVYFVDNVLMGGGDDGFDIDGTDAWIENNIFLHIHQNGAPDSSSAVSGGDDSGNTSEITILGNLIYDCDNAATAKQGNFFTLFNNTIVHTTKQGGNDFASGIVNVRDTTPSLTTFGKGYYLEGNVITDADQLVRNYDATQVTVTFNNNILPMPWDGPGTGNYVGNALLKHIPAVEETQFSSWEQAQVLRDWFTPRAGSPARGTGPGGKDKGAAVPPGIYVSGQPKGVISATTATLTLGINRSGSGIPASGWPQGSGFVAYKWRIDGNAWSDEIPIATPIVLSNLSNGLHIVEVAGKTDAGLYENDPLFGEDASVATVSWTVDTGAPAPAASVRLNEILARNTHVLTNSLATPDLVELFNFGSSAVDLSGFRLTPDTNGLVAFVFPQSTTLAAGEYRVLFADASTNSGLHLGFNLNASGDSLYLMDPAGRVVDSVQFGVQASDLSLGRSFDGSWTLCEPTFGVENRPLGLAGPQGIRINEWLANTEFAPAGSFVELYNPASQPVALGGLFLSDAAGTPDRYQIPPLSFIGAGSFLAFASDGKAAPGHLNFKLSADVGQIQLADENLVPLDLVSYGPQTTDISEGRSPNGSDNIGFLVMPTPGAANPGGTASGGGTNVIRTTVSALTLTNTWRYDANGVDHGTAWRAANYNDETWSSGRALLYHGNGASKMPIPVATTLPFKTPEQSTFYFRAHFNYTGPVDSASLNLTEVIDDGLVVYLNGNEIFRRNMPAGLITYSTFSSSTISDATLVGPLSAPATGLIQGDNVVAVEVHQANLSSSDIAMALAVDVVTSVTNVVGGSQSGTVLLNELLARNAAGGPDWAELYNPSTNRLDLSGVSLSDDPANPARWRFAAGTFIEAGSFLVVSFDPLAPPSTNNTGFGLEQDGGTLYLFDAPVRGGGLVDAVRYGIQVAGLSLGRVPDGSGPWTLNQPSPGATNRPVATGSVQDLRINEWMASPSVGNDWFEIFNGGSAPVALGGLFLTDDLTDRAKFHIAPLSFIGVGTNAFLRMEADSSPGKGARHADFNLSAKGEEIGIYDANGVPIDSVVFGAQTVDVSQGRLPDGSPNIVDFPAPTPGRSNSAPVAADSDGDGLPDAWEIAHFGNLSRDGSGDFDGDGFTDLQEFLAGTDPANASDFLKIEAAGSSAGAFLLNLHAVAGKSYAIEYRDALGAGAWTKLQDVSASSTGVTQVSDPAFSTARHRFYRVRLE